MVEVNILRVSLADKVHNARSILRDLRKPEIDEKIWTRFSQPKDEMLWYYRSLDGAAAIRAWHTIWCASLNLAAKLNFLARHDKTTNIACGQVCHHQVLGSTPC